MCCLVVLPCFALPSREDTLQQRLQEDPEDIDALLQMALVLAGRNEFTKAVETYFTVLRHDPRNFHAYHNLGILYKNRGQFQDSLFCYEKAREINPESDKVHFNLGLAYKATGQIDKAKESFGRALSLNPDFSDALEQLLALNRGQTDEPPLPPPPGAATRVAATPRSQPTDTATEPKPAGSATSEKPVSAATASATTKLDAAKTKPGLGTKQTSTDAAAKGHRKTVRTRRQGPTAGLFNEAMESLEKGNIEWAMELYVRCVIADRELLAEPESGLIQEALEYVRDRPNRMKDGLFYRGYLKSLAQSEEAACPDLSSYLELGPAAEQDPIFVREARGVIERYERRLAEIKAEEARLASEALLLAEQERQQRELASETAVAVPTGADVQAMDAAQLLVEAERLLKGRKIAEAITILEGAATRFPEDLKVLMALANAYTDQFLAHNDQQAGRKARDTFVKAFQLAPTDSPDAKLAANMAEELDKRLR